MIQINEKFKPLFEEPNGVRYFIITGGRGSSKSFTVNTYLNLKTFTKGVRILFTRYTMVSANLSIIPEFIEKIELLNAADKFAVNKTEVRNLETTSDIIFKGIKTSSGDQTAALKSLQGVNVFVVDEAEELVDEDTFDKIDLSVRDKKSKNIVILILNPTTKEHWIYNRFFEQKGVQGGWNGVKDDVCYIHTTYLDNKVNLSDSFVKQVENIRDTNPEKYYHVILGGWRNKAEGVILDNWELGEYQDVGTTGYGQDYGFSVDPTTLVKVSIDKKNKVIYCKELLYKTGLATTAIAQENKKHCTARDLIVGDSAEPRLITELSSHGLNIQAAEKGQGSVGRGIKLLQDYRLIIDPSSLNLVKELNNYAWNDKKSEVPNDEYNHLIDALRYIVVRLVGAGGGRILSFG